MAETRQSRGGAKIAALYAEIARAKTKNVPENTKDPHGKGFKSLDFNLQSLKSIVLEMEDSDEDQEYTKLLYSLLKRVKEVILEFPRVKEQIAKLGFKHFQKLKKVNEELKSFCQNWEYQKAKQALENEVEAANGSVEIALLILKKIRAIILQHTATVPKDFRSIFESLEVTLGPIEQMVQQMDRSVVVPFMGHRDAKLFSDLLTTVIDCLLHFKCGQRQDSIKKNLEYHEKRLRSFLPDEVQMERDLQEKAANRNECFWRIIISSIIAIIGLIIVIANGQEKSFSAPSRSNTSIFGFLSRFFDGNSNEYDVFLSFRGADTREKFTRFLYDALEHENLRTFMDDTIITPGEEIPLRIVEGIKNSLNAVVIFSENFANSSWCLDELLHIYERKETFAKYKIFPICYYITPEDVYEDGRKYHQELEKHKTQYGHKVPQWKEVLNKFENISAATLEGKMRVNVFIKDIVEMIKNSTKGLPTHVG